MMKALILTAAGLIGLGSSVSFANCSDGYVADCGNFRVLETSCPMYNKLGAYIGHSEEYSAVFTDASQPEVKFNRWPTANSQPLIYRGVVNSESDLYITKKIETGMDGKPYVSFASYKIVWGQQSPTVSCTAAQD